MSLRFKTLLVIGLTLSGLLLAVYLISRAILSESYAQLEAQNMRRDVERALNALSDDVDVLDRTTRDYARWDDTYAYIEDANPDYLAANYIAPTFVGNRLSLVMLLNLAGDVMFVQAFDLNTEAETAASPSLLETVSRSDALKRHTDLEGAAKGIVLLPEGALLIASRPILTSLNTGPIRGALIMGRALDDAELKRLAETTRLSLDLYQPGDAQVPPEVRAAAQPASPDAPIVVRPLDEDNVAGYVTLSDIAGQPSLVLQVTAGREVFQQGQQSLSLLVGAILITALVFSAVIVVLLERLVLARLARLHADVSTISATGDLSGRVTVRGSDELSNLGQAMNQTLVALERALQELVQARDQALDALRFKSRFLANVSHDLRTPMNAILGYVEMLQEGVYGEVPEQPRRVLPRIHESAQQLLSQINDLLDQSRLEAGALKLRNAPFAPSDLVESVQAVAGALAQAKRLRLTSQVAENVPAQLVGDFDRLRQILLNLVNNAIKFTDQGEVSLRVYRPDAAHWAMEVTDTGHGIPPEAQEYIFEPFRQVESTEKPASGDASHKAATRKHGGVGLGLSIVKQLTVLMGGQIALDSQVHRGSTFTVRLPLVVSEE